MMLRPAIVGVVLLSTSCAGLRPAATVERIAFPQEEYSSLPEAGTAVVHGQAFLKTRGGDVKTAAGEEVILNPVTSYSPTVVRRQLFKWETSE